MAKGSDLLVELVGVFTAAAGVGVPLARMKLPPVLGYLAVGVVLGPGVSGFVTSRDAVTGLAEIGVALLLLGIGLEFGTDKLRRLARPMAIAGSVQLFGTLAAGFGIGLALGLDPAAAFALGGVIALSSTAIVLRLVQERGGLGSGEGVVVTSVLVLQDLAVVPLVLVVEALGTGGSAGEIGGAVLRAAAALAVAWGVARAIAPRLLVSVARLASQELFVMAVLAIAGSVALVCSLAGLSPALGAFLAGVVLADGRFAHRATREILPLRAVTAAIFFASIGMLLEPATVIRAPLAIAGAVLGVFLGKAVLAGVGARLSGLPWGPSLRAGILLAQIGEFSFVLAGTAVAVGVFEDDLAAVLTAVTIASMALTAAIGSSLGRGGGDLPELDQAASPGAVDVVIAGVGVGGQAALEAAREQGRSVVVVEQNPETVGRLRAAGQTAFHGDATDTAILASAGMAATSTLVIAVSDLGAAYAAARNAHARWPEARVLLRVRFEEDTRVALADGIEVICEELEGARALGAALRAR